MMTAWFQCDISGCTARSIARCLQGMNFGVSLTGAFMPTLANYTIISHQYTADAWVGAGSVKAAFCQA